MAGFDYPVFVVTTRVGVDRAACLVGFAGQVSIRPLRVLVGLSRKNHTYRTPARDATHVAVHLIAREHRELARLFGAESGDRVDKFSRCSWWDGPAGIPIRCDSPAWFVGRLRGRVDLGDHVGHLTEPVAGHVGPDPLDLVRYGNVKDPDSGHEA